MEMKTKHRGGGIAHDFQVYMRNNPKADPVARAELLAVEVIPWGSDCNRYEFKDGTRIVHNWFIGGWDI
jgi:hypothetical protein